MVEYIGFRGVSYSEYQTQKKRGLVSPLFLSLQISVDDAACLFLLACVLEGVTILALCEARVVMAHQLGSVMAVVPQAVKLHCCIRMAQCFPVKVIDACSFDDALHQVVDCLA